MKTATKLLALVASALLFGAVVCADDNDAAKAGNHNNNNNSTDTHKPHEKPTKGVNHDKSGFVAEIVSPFKGMPALHTGDKLNVTWRCDDISPEAYPNDGMHVAIYRERRKFVAESTTREFHKGINSVEITVPRFVVRNSSDEFYVRFSRGGHIYAESEHFTIINDEQGEEKQEWDEPEERHYIDYLLSPEYGQVFKANDTMRIEFQPDTPIPPKKRLQACLTRVRNNWFDKKCIEKISIEGPIATRTSILYVIPAYTVPSPNYVVQIYDLGWLESDMIYQSGTFAIVGANDTVPAVNGTTAPTHGDSHNNNGTGTVAPPSAPANYTNLPDVLPMPPSK